MFFKRMKGTLIGVVCYYENRPIKLKIEDSLKATLLVIPIIQSSCYFYSSGQRELRYL